MDTPTTLIGLLAAELRNVETALEATPGAGEPHDNDREDAILKALAAVRATNAADALVQCQLLDRIHGWVTSSTYDDPAMAKIERQLQRLLFSVAGVLADSLGGLPAGVHAEDFHLRNPWKAGTAGEASPRPDNVFDLAFKGVGRA